MSVRRRRLTFAALFACSAAGILAACTVFSDVHLPQASGDDAADGTDARDATPPDPCKHAVPPNEPEASDEPDKDIGELIFALGSYSFHAELGYDLDGVCTCGPHASSVPDVPSCRSGADAACDEPGGIDNALGNIGEMYASTIADVFNNLIKQGRRTGLLQIRQYNGLANDSRVQVALLDGAGLPDAGCPSSVYDTGRKVWSPGWCGLDSWSVDSRSVFAVDGGAGVPIPVVTASDAYVVNHRLVARIDGNGGGIPLPGASSSKNIKIDSAFITATLESTAADGGALDPTKPYFSIRDGILAGRVSTAAFLGWVGTQNVTGMPLCEDPMFDIVKGRVCGAADLAATGRFEPNSPCTSFSAGISFTAFTAQRGNIKVEGAQNGPCDPGADGNPVDASVRYTCP